MVSQGPLARSQPPRNEVLGVAGALAQPSLGFVDSSGNLVASNSVWSSDSNASRTAVTAQPIGAYAIESGSADSALLLSLPPGAHTTVESGVEATSGVALAEVWDVPRTDLAQPSNLQSCRTAAICIQRAPKDADQEPRSRASGWVAHMGGGRRRVLLRRPRLSGSG